MANPELYELWMPSVRENLTPKEREVLKYIARGLDYHGISKELNITWNTVRHHKRNLYEKLGAHSALEAVLTALSVERDIFSLSELVDVKEARRGLGLLTQKQKKVLKTMYEILSPGDVNRRAVAKSLGVAPSTVGGYRNRICRKLRIPGIIPAMLMVMAADEEGMEW